MFAHEGSPSVKDTSDLPECSELSGGGGGAERASRMASCVMGRDIVTADCCGGEDEDEEGSGGNWSWRYKWRRGSTWSAT